MSTSSADLLPILLVLGGFLLFLVILLVAFAVSLVWVYRDAEARKGEGLAWLMFSVFFWPIPPIVWLFIRPKKAEASAE